MKLMVKHSTCLLFVVGFFLIMLGCGDSNVSSVKNGTMDGYDSTTVGKAFEGSFDNATWKFLETEKGQKIVEFNGTISEALHSAVVSDIDISNDVAIVQMYIAACMTIGDEKCNQIIKKAGGSPGKPEKEQMLAIIKEFLNNYVWKPGTPVEVQWTISTDGKSFKLSYMGSEAWKDVSYDDILEVIYQ